MQDMDVSGGANAGERPTPAADFVTALLDTVGALVIVLDAEGRIVRFNQACERATGYLCSEVEGRPFWDFLLPSDEVQPVKKVFAQLQAGQFPNVHQNHWVAKDGNRRLIAWSNTALLAEDGSVELVIGTGIDITERRQAEAERERLLAQVTAEQKAVQELAQTLQRERDTLQAIMENTHTQIAYLNRQFEFVRVNSAYAEGSGHRQEELIGRNHFELFPNEENQAIFEQVRDTGKPVEFRAKPFQYADQPERGTTYWDWTLIPVMDESGSVQGLVLSLTDVSEQVQAAAERERLLGENRAQRESLQRRVEEQNAIYAALAEGVVVYDVSGTPIEANPAAIAAFGERILGADRAELARAVSLRRPDGQPVAREELPVSRALRGERVTGEHLVFTDAEGRERAMLASATPLYGGGQLVGAVAAWHDITKEDEVERALRQSEEKLKKLFEILPIGVSVLDEDRKIQSANPALSSILGLSAEALSEGSFGRRTYLTADGKPFPYQKFPSVRAFEEQKLVQDVEIGVVKEDGELIWTSVSAAPLPFPDWRVIVATADITARKRAEEALRRERDFIAAVLDTSGGLVIVLDRQGRIVRFNRACEQATSYTFEEVRDKPFWDLLLVPEEMEAVKTEFAGLEAARVPSTHENYWLAKDGTRRWIAWSNTALTDESGSVEYIIGTGIDITERRRAEQELQRALNDSRQRQAEVAALLDGARQVLAGQRFEDTARIIFDSCKKLTGATAGYVALSSRDGTRNEVLFLDPGERPCTVDPTLPMPIRGLRGQVYQTGRVAFENAFASSQWAPFLPEGHVGVDNLLFAPLVVSGQVVGLLGLANKPGGFTESDVRLAEAFGELAAIALHNSQLRESLEASELRFRSVVETASAAIVTADSEGQITFWNRMAEMTFGYSAQEIVGASLERIMPECFRSAHRAGMQRVLETGRSRLAGQTVETIGLRKNGQEFPLQLSLATWKTAEDTFFTAVLHDITSRRQAEETLREALQSFETVFRASPLAIIAFDLSGSIRLWNPAAERIFGWSEAEVLGRPNPIVPEDRRTEFQNIIARAVAGETLSVLETVRQKKDGTRIDVNLWSAPLYDAEGKTRNVMVVLADITDRKQAEETLQRYARQQSSLYTVASAVSATLDRDGLLPIVLDAVLRALDACAGWILMPHPSPSDPPRVVARRGTCEGSLAAETVLPVQSCPLYRDLSPEGSAAAQPQVMVDCPTLLAATRRGLEEPSLVCVPLYAGNLLQGVLKMIWREPRQGLQTDQELLLTIGRQVGVALHNAQLFQTARQLDRLQALSDLDRALAATFDLHKLAEETMQRVRAYLDVPAAAIILLPAADPSRPTQELITSLGAWANVAIAERDWARWQAFLGRLSNQPEPVNLSPEEFGMVSHDSELVRQWYQDAIVVPIRGERSFLALLALGGRGPDRPLTDEDRALAAVAASHAGQAMQNAQLYNELRGLLAEREQTRAQLIQSEKLAALGRLSASIAHEINNPLQAIANCLTLAQEEIDSAQRRDKLERYLGIVGAEVGRISGIVRQMRDYYRPAHERLQPTDLLAVLDSVLDLSGKELQHRKVTVQRSGRSELPLIQANSDHLKQVFLNLILNAMDAMPTGGTLRVQTHLDQIKLGAGRSQPAVRIEISDTGQGIPPEAAAHLFEPFFTTKEQGAGLGLYISYSIVEAHNGRISVSSNVGQGTTFTILLPIAQP